MIAPLGFSYIPLLYIPEIFRYDGWATFKIHGSHEVLIIFLNFQIDIVCTTPIPAIIFGLNETSKDNSLQPDFFFCQ